MWSKIFFLVSLRCNWTTQQDFFFRVSPKPTFYPAIEASMSAPACASHSESNITTTGVHAIFTADDLSISLPHLKSKYTSRVMLLYLTAFSFCCLLVNDLIFSFLCCYSPQGAEVKMHHVKQQQKREENVLMCFGKVELQRSEGCLYKGFWSRTFVCMIVEMHECTIYTASVFAR